MGKIRLEDWTGQATGARHTQLKAELDEFVRELLGSDKSGS